MRNSGVGSVLSQENRVRLTTFVSFLEGAERYAELELKPQSECYYEGICADLRAAKWWAKKLLEQAEKKK